MRLALLLHSRALVRLLFAAVVALAALTPAAALAAPSAQDAPRRPINERFPVPTVRPTKWGVGLYTSCGDHLNSLKASRPGVILLLDPNPEFAREVRRTFPDAFIVGRLYAREDEQLLDNSEQRGVAFADRVAQHAVPLKGAIDAWMSYNEVTGTGNVAQYRAYIAFQVAFARRLQGTHGVAAVAGNDGSGAIEPEDYPRYFADAIRESAYFGVHAYSAPSSGSMRQDAEWHTLRYRKIHAALERAGIHGVPMVITESGLGDGWRDFSSPDGQAADFAWFTDELHRDPYMIGHAAFGLFSAGNKE